MPGLPAYERVAYIARPKGLKGELIVYISDGFVFCLKKGMHLALVPPSYELARRLKVRTCKKLSDTSACLSFDGCNDYETASKLSGHYLLAPVQELPASYKLAPKNDFLLGHPVLDLRYGMLGRISEILKYPAHDVWLVKKDDSEILIPAVPQVICEMPDERSDKDAPVRTHIMDGIVDEEYQ